jgi:hypothetical protein
MSIRDEDPRHIEIMEKWARKIVAEVAQRLAEGIVEDVGRIFLDAKTSYHEAYIELERRLDALEKATKADKMT